MKNRPSPGTRPSASNVAKHGYDFVALREVFDGRFRVVAPDLRRDYGEDRYNMLVEHGDGVVNVTFPPTETGYRVISARPASRTERTVYHDRREEG